MVDNPARARSGGTIGPDHFAAIATCTGVAWVADGALEITFDRDLTAAEEAEVRDWCQSTNDVEVTLRQQAAAALDSNRTFLALASPTAAQNAAQAKALTRQMQAVIRLALGQLDSTD